MPKVDYDDSPLNYDTLHAAMNVPAHDQSVSRSIIDGVVCISALDHEPDWLLGLKAQRDAEDDRGN